MTDTTPMVAETGTHEVQEITESDRTNYLCSYRFVEVILCLITPFIGLCLHQLVDPYQRPIPHQTLEDGTIVRNLLYDYPEAGETVGSTLLLVLAIPVPILSQVALCYLLTRNNPREERAEILHRTACVYFLGIGLTFTLTSVCKLYSGYFRPIFYDLCEPSEDYQECLNKAEYHAGEADKAGRMSFPSGHASFSVCSLLLFSLFLEHSYGKTAYSRTKNQSNGDERQKLAPPQRPWIRIVSVLCYTPMLLAIFIGLSRIHDNQHHPADFVGGTLLGGCIANFVFGIWFS